jgi:ketosteroid isomerase-like protein
MLGGEQILRSVYRAINARDIATALELMDPDVDWPNAWEGGRVVGREAVADYWRRQFSALSSTVNPESFTNEPDGSVTVEVMQWFETRAPRSSSRTPGSATATASGMA